jgi:DNA end-binding protein Ku
MGRPAQPEELAPAYVFLATNADSSLVLRTTTHLAVVAPAGRALMLDTLRFADELRDAAGLELPPEGLKSAGVQPKEVELAKRLVDDMTKRWKPAQYRNTYHDDLMARIRQKIKEGRHARSRSGSATKRSRARRRSSTSRRC